MDKLIWVAAGLGAFIVIAMGNNSATTPGANTATKCDVGNPSPGRFYPKVEAEFRTGPGTNYPMVVNAAGPKSDGKSENRTVDPQYVLEGICATNEWLQAKIVEADGMPEAWETGWVPKRLVTTTLTAEHAAGLWWNVEKMPDFWGEHPHISSSEIRTMHDGALKVLKDNKNCGSIAVGYPDDKRRHTYDVECNGNENTNGSFVVRFTENDLRSGKSFAPPEAFPSELSNQMCQEEILRAATHPSTVNFHIFGLTQAVNAETGERKILREFDAKNGFGLELNYAALCVIKPSGKITVAINETR